MFNTFENLFKKPKQQQKPRYLSSPEILDLGMGPLNQSMAQEVAQQRANVVPIYTPRAQQNMFNPTPFVPLTTSLPRMITTNTSSYAPTIANTQLMSNTNITPSIRDYLSSRIAPQPRTNDVPLRKAVEAIGGNVEWDNDTRQAMVSFDGYGKVPAQGRIVNDRFVVDSNWLNNWLQSEFNVNIAERLQERQYQQQNKQHPEGHQLAYNLLTNRDSALTGLGVIYKDEVWDIARILTEPKVYLGKNSQCDDDKRARLIQYMAYSFGLGNNDVNFGFNPQIDFTGEFCDRTRAFVKAVDNLVLYGTRNYKGDGNFTSKIGGAIVQLLKEIQEDPEKATEIQQKLSDRFEMYFYGTDMHRELTRPVQGVAVGAMSGAIWPVDLRTVNSEFGHRPRGGVRGNPIQPHEGVDIPVNRQPVRAVLDGQVISIDNSMGIVTIRHDNGHITRSIHLALPHIVRVGERIAQGQQIGISGDTGSPGAFHLHFEIWRPIGNGQYRAQNPVQFFDNLNILSSSTRRYGTVHEIEFPDGQGQRGF